MKYYTKQSSGNELGIFSIRGDLDGGKESSDFFQARQFIGFLVGLEEFLLPIDVMNEIIMLNQLTFVPGSQEYIEGVINLRGKIIAAINIRKMMGLPHTKPTNSTRVIIARYDDINAGLIVDGITYVVSLHPDQMETHSLSGKGKGANLISGIAKRGDQVNGIIDICKILNEAGAKIGSSSENEDLKKDAQ